MATKMAYKSAVKIDVEGGRLQHQVKSGKIVLNPTLASDLEPLVKIGLQYSYMEA